MGKGDVRAFVPYFPLSKLLIERDIKYLQGLLRGVRLSELNDLLGNNTPKAKANLREAGYITLNGEKGERGEPQFPIIYVVYSPFYQGEIIRGDDACIMLDRLFETRLKIPPIPPQKRLIVTRDLVGMMCGIEPTLKYWYKDGYFDNVRLKLKPEACAKLMLISEVVNLKEITKSKPPRKRGSAKKAPPKKHKTGDSFLKKRKKRKVEDDLDSLDDNEEEEVDFESELEEKDEELDESVY